MSIKEKSSTFVFRLTGEDVIRVARRMACCRDRVLWGYVTSFDQSRCRHVLPHAWQGGKYEIFCVSAPRRRFIKNGRLTAIHRFALDAKEKCVPSATSAVLIQPLRAPVGTNGIAVSTQLQGTTRKIAAASPLPAKKKRYSMHICFYHASFIPVISFIMEHQGVVKLALKLTTSGL